MRMRVLAMLCGGAAIGLAVTGFAAAETLVVDDHVVVKQTSVQTPKRGSTMSEVEQHFGAPVQRHPTVSDPGRPGQPPITRWDYAGFSVVFERDRVIDSVVTGG